MADINIGDVVARLRADLTQFNQGIAEAVQRLQSLNQAASTIRQQQGTQQQSTNQLAQAYQALAQAITQQSHAYSQTQQSLTAYRQQQDALRDALNRQRDAQRQATEEAHKASGAWRNMLQIAGGIGIASSFQEIARAIKDVVVEAVSLSARLEDLNRSFQAIEGGIQAANARMASLFQTAQRLGVDFITATEGFRRFNAAARGTALEGQGVQRAFEGLLAGSRALGLSSDDSRRALAALEQALSKGKIQAEELRGQLAEAIPGAIRLFAEGLGISTQTLESMIQTGLLPADAAIIGLTDRLRQLGEVGGASGGIERMSNVFARLKNETTAWLTALGDGINTVLRPFLQELTSLSEELRRVFNIRTPGQQGPAGITAMPATTPQNIAAIIAKEAGSRNLDPGLLARLIKAESNFNPNAVSAAGAVGLGQLLPSTARDLMPGVTEAQLRDPETNIRLAAEYLSRLMQTFSKDTNQVELALAAYNAGLGRVTKVINETVKITGQTADWATIAAQLPQETQAYVKRIMAMGTMQGLATAGPGQSVPGAIVGTGIPAAQGGVGGLSPQAMDAMLKGVRDAMTLIPQLQKQFESLRDSEMNFGGVLTETFKKQADDAVEKFRSVAALLAQMPEVAAQMTEEQRDQVKEAARLVAEFQEQVNIETQGAGEASKRIGVLREIQRLEEQLQNEFLNEQKTSRQQRIREMDIFGLDIAPEDQQALDQFTRAETERRKKMWQEIDLFSLGLAPEQEAERQQLVEEAKKRRQEMFKSLDIFGLDLSPDQERSRAFTERLQTQLTILQTPRDQRLGEQLRGAARKDQVTLTDEHEALLRQIRRQEQLNTLIDTMGRIGNSAAGILTNSLLSIADGTRTVSEAFREMGQQILRTIAQITLNEGFSILLRLGLGAVAGALTGGAGASVATPAGPTSAGGTGFEILMAQGGAIVNRPTAILAGENPAMNPEVVLNRPQFQSLMHSAMRAGPSAGGQAANGANVTIINVSSREQGEARAAQERALGKQVVLNYILDDLAAGSSSKVGQMIRMGGHR